MSAVNEESTKRMKEFIAAQEKELASFVRCTLGIEDSAEFKLSCISDKVAKQRKDLLKFEKSLEWEDE